MSGKLKKYSAAAGAGTRIATRLFKFAGKNAKSFLSADGVYEIATATATGSMCAIIEARTQGKGLVLIGTGALIK